MDRLLVVVFDNEGSAYEGRNALLQLDREGSITVFAHAVLAKHADGTATLRQADDFGPLGTLVGTSLGSVIGLLGGPAGLALGAATGALAGGGFDLDNARLGEGFIHDVTTALSPDKFAVVAEIEEGWTTPVDMRMEALGGFVVRRALWEVARAVDDEEIAAMKADLAQLKAEHAEAHAERKAKLQNKIDELDAKIQARVKKAKDKLETVKQQAQAKVQHLERKATAARARVS
jgi:uncharacterized membrane protein